jgi:hypothetical protein
LIGYATEIRKRAERRLGEVMKANADAGKMAKGTRGKIVGPGRGKKRQVARKPAVLKDEVTLKQQGIDKHLADRVRKSAAMTEDKFEASVAKPLVSWR